MACGGAASSAKDYELVTVLKLGEKVEYTIPSFPVFTASLVEMKYQLVDDDSTIVFDGYIRDCPDLDRSYPSLLKLYSGYTNGFLIDPEEFNRSVTVDPEKIFCDGMVFVIWKWTWEDSPEQNESSSGVSSVISVNNNDSDHSSDNDECASTLVTHSLIFKCIGATKSVQSQEVLSEAAQKLKRRENVLVRLRREPTNSKDSRAIAFDCSLGNECWVRIGYVVKEALDAVHHAIEQKCIETVQFAWVRYITHWSRCDPGWYSGIKITKKGDWPREVVRCSSTI